MGGMSSIPPDPKRARSLESRIFDFLSSRPDAEDIDKLELTKLQKEKSKADYFLRKRSIVCEVKNLETDTKEKIEQLIKPVLSHKDAPVYYGAWELAKILKLHPDGERISRDVFEAATSAIQTLFRKANQQIRSTKDIFGVPNAGGLLVIANDLVEILTPEILSSKIRELYQKRTQDGCFQFTEIDAVWILQETHFIEVGPGIKGVPALIVTREKASPTLEVLEGMQSEWAIANGMPIIGMDPELAGTLKFNPLATKGPTVGKVTRQQVWEEQYRTSPYLRRHTVEELGSYFRLVMTGLTLGFLKGATAEEREIGVSLIERWTHLLQEIKERGLDMRTFSPGMQEMGAEVRAGKRPKVSQAEVEAAGKKPVTLNPFEYYTNKEGKNFLCISSERELAGLILFDGIMGKTLEIKATVAKKDWHYFWPILDAALLKALDRRFLHLKSQHPELFRGVS